jgi:tetratricopeptide (TPR) repeat protein
MNLSKSIAIVICYVLSACAPSVLIKKKDPTFDYARERFQKTANHLQAINQTDTSKIEKISDDQSLFLQAESYYRYRLELQDPSVRSLATKALAATTDFAPLSVWAASTEINQLRMQSYNGAAQLYEAFLERYPNSELRPLALYRLGWTYRNTSIEGFPRNEREAFEELLKNYPTSPYAPMAKEILHTPFKSQGKAAAWSLIPGAGQMYVGEWRLGAIHLSIATAFTAVAIVPPTLMVKDQKLDWLGLGISLAGIVGLQVSYTIAYQDAQRRAISFNEHQEMEFEYKHPDAP